MQARIKATWFQEKLKSVSLNNWAVQSSRVHISGKTNRYLHTCVICLKHRNLCWLTGASDTAIPLHIFICSLNHTWSHMITQDETHQQLDTFHNDTHCQLPQSPTFSLLNSSLTNFWISPEIKSRENMVKSDGATNYRMKFFVRQTFLEIGFTFESFYYDRMEAVESVGQQATNLSCLTFWKLWLLVSY